VVPAPFGPRKPTTSPGSISNEIPSTARTSRVLRRTRLRSASPTPASRSGTTNVFRSSWTRTSATSLQLSLPLRIPLPDPEHPQAERDRGRPDHEQRPELRPDVADARTVEDRMPDPAQGVRRRRDPPDS